MARKKCQIDYGCIRDVVKYFVLMKTSRVVSVFVTAAQMN